jgi:predicted transposase YdaD
MFGSVAEAYYNEAAMLGEARGEARGEVRGEIKGEAKSIIRILNRRLGMPTSESQEKILSVKSAEQLDEFLDFALTCVSFGEFETALN